MKLKKKKNTLIICIHGTKEKTTDSQTLKRNKKPKQ
jgi:hypothetical protein